MADFRATDRTDSTPVSYGDAYTASTNVTLPRPTSPNPYVVKPATPLPARAAKAKTSQNPFILDPVQLSKKNPFLIPLLPNPDLFGINIPT